MEFKIFMESDDYWAKRLAQFQAAASGQKDAISDDRSKVGDYKAQQQQAPVAKEEPVEWITGGLGMIYEKPRTTDAPDLYFHNTFDKPASDGSYYYRDKASGRFRIRRPGINKLFRKI